MFPIEKEGVLERTIREEVANFPSNYRCHEGARMIARKLRSLGIDVEVRDGGVIYDTSYFLKDLEDFLDSSLLESSSEEERKLLEKELRPIEEVRKVSNLHSWCEFRDDSGAVIVIDWHAHLLLSPCLGVENNLIIDRKDDLPHKYIPFGIVIGKWIFFWVFPLHTIKLRV